MLRVGPSAFLATVGAIVVGVAAWGIHQPIAARPGEPAPRLEGASRTDVARSDLAVLPVEGIDRGPETLELRVVRENTEASRRPLSRAGVFGARRTAATAYARPAGLRPTQLALPTDAQIDAMLGVLARDEEAHAAVTRALAARAAYGSVVEQALRAWRVPEELVALTLVESAFDPTAVTSDGRAGLWCLSSEVARSYGLVTVVGYDERRGIRSASSAAAHYLSDLHDRFGSWELAILAFGFGYRATVDTLDQSSPADVWKLPHVVPSDALGYLREVLAVALVLANPGRFGFDEARGPSPQITSDLEVPAGTNFGLLARAAAMSAGDLRALNPEYVSDLIPDAGIAMLIHLPADRLARAKEMLMPLLYAPSSSALNRASAPIARSPGEQRNDVETTGGVFYRTRSGDTLDGIARRFGLNPMAVATDNALDPTSPVSPGRTLIIRTPSPPLPH